MWKFPGNVRYQIALILLLAILPLALLAIYLEVQAGREQATRARADSHATVRQVVQDVNRVIQSSSDLVLAFSHISAKHGESCDSQLAALKPAFPQFANMFMVDRESTIVCAASNPLKLRSLRDRPENDALMMRVLSTRGVAVGSFALTAPGKRVVPVAGPVMDETGEVRSVFFVTLDLEWLNDRVNRISLPEGAVLLVMDDHGRELARNPRAPWWLAGMPAPPLERTLVGQRDFDREVRGYDRISRFYSLASAGEGASIQVVMKTRLSQIYQPSQRRLALHLGGLAGVGLLVLGLTWVGSNRYFRLPVAKLIETSGQLAAGQLEARSGLSLQGEMGSLAQSFDRMADTLEQNHARERESAVRESGRLKRLKQLSEFSMMLAGDPAIVFERIVRLLGELFEVRAVCLSELTGDDVIFRAIYMNGDVVSNAGGCALAITPCCSVVASREIRIHQKVQEKFPEAEFLRELNAQSWCGFPSLDSEGNVVGVTCLVDDKPREFSEEDQQILWVVGQRIATEFDRGRHMGERARMEETLLENKRGLEEAQHMARVGSYSGDGDTGIMKWSDELYRIFEADPSAGVPDLALVLEKTHPDDRARIAENSARVTREGGDFEVEHRLQMPDGRVKHVLVQGTSIRAADRKLWVRGTVQDVTDRKRAEEEKTQLRSQLNQAQKMESIGRLAGGIAHDFNNLLTVVTGYSHLLLDQGGLPDRVRSRIEEIHKAGERAAKLTQQLLTFSRKQVIMPRNVNLNGVISEVAGMLAPMMGEDIRITAVLAPDLGPALVDPDQMHQVVMNLAVNARDAMPEGGDLRFETSNVAVGTKLDSNLPAGITPGCYVLLSVSDSGTGMDAETMQLIFEPFFTTKPIGQGTGLGLSTVHGIVRQSGGWIAAQSERGKGTSFRIYFPRVNSPAGEGGPRRDEPAARGAGETILVVEDQDAVLEFTADVLCDLGYRVLKARGAEDAIRFAHENRTIDLMITDVVMPGMSGPQLANNLEAVRPHLKVLFASGYAENTAAMKPGAHYLPKPFTYEALAAKVREIIG